MVYSAILMSFLTVEQCQAEKFLGSGYIKKNYAGRKYNLTTDHGCTYDYHCTQGLRCRKFVEGAEDGTCQPKCTRGAEGRKTECVCGSSTDYCDEGKICIFRSRWTSWARTHTCGRPKEEAVDDAEEEAVDDVPSITTDQCTNYGKSSSENCDMASQLPFTSTCIWTGETCVTQAEENVSVASPTDGGSPPLSALKQRTPQSFLATDSE